MSDVLMIGAKRLGKEMYSLQLSQTESVFAAAIAADPGLRALVNYAQSEAEHDAFARHALNKWEHGNE